MKAQEQAKNAIRWIDTLPSYKQARKGSRGMLGDENIGFSCLGAGCEELGIKHWSESIYSRGFGVATGLRNLMGLFEGSNSYYGEYSLSGVSDYTNAGFKRISKLLKTHPDWMFKPEVAKLIKEHYS